MALLVSLAALLSACTGGTRETPGTQPNDRLASLLQKELDAGIARMNPVWSPGLSAEAPDHARGWLKDIAEVVARCRYGPRNRSKHNLLVYDIALRSGETVTDVFSGHRCLYGMTQPLVMRVRFEDGVVREVLTDGRERRSPVDAVSVEVQQFARCVLRAGQDRSPERYRPPAPTATDIANDWNRPAR